MHEKSNSSVSAWFCTTKAPSSWGGTSSDFDIFLIVIMVVCLPFAYLYGCWRRKRGPDVLKKYSGVLFCEFDSNEMVFWSSKLNFFVRKTIEVVFRQPTTSLKNYHVISGTSKIIFEFEQEIPLELFYVDNNLKFDEFRKRLSVLVKECEVKKGASSEASKL